MDFQRRKTHCGGKENYDAYLLVKKSFVLSHGSSVKPSLICCYPSRGTVDRLVEPSLSNLNSFSFQLSDFR